MKSLVQFFVCSVVVLSSFSAVAGTRSGGAPSPFIAAVVAYDRNVEVWLNPRSYWNDVGGLTASYTDAEWAVVAQIVEAAGLCNVAESTYEDCGGERSVAQLKADLARAGVEIDRGFQEWADAEILAQ